MKCRLPCGRRRPACPPGASWGSPADRTAAVASEARASGRHEVEDLPLSANANRCALLLALIMTLSAMYKHPWFITMWSKSTFALDFVVGFEDPNPNLTLT